MIIIKNNQDLQEIIRKKRISKKIGFVPTMGAIHNGHLSLVEHSRKDGCFTCASIFVNPTQFNDSEDFKSYPKNFQKDLELLKNKNCDLVFIPTINQIYPKSTTVTKKIKMYRKILCDNFRPGHFDGVTTVVNRLLSIVNPNFAYFGEKDYQQLKIIKNLVKNEKFITKIIGCPSIRYENGISISSRYEKFNSEQNSLFNQVAEEIIKTLNLIKKRNNIDVSISKCVRNLNTMGIKKIDYIEVRNNDSLKLTDKFVNSRLFIALYLDNIRIIDNFII